MNTIRFFLGFAIIMSCFCCNNEQVVTRDSLKLLGYAEQQIGTPYDSGNNKGFDCSGFVQTCYKSIEIKVPNSSKALSKLGRKIDLSNISPGDIMVFTGTNKKNRTPGHVALFHHTTNDTLFFIHSSSSKGVRYNNLSESYYKDRFLELRRVIGEKTE